MASAGSCNTGSFQEDKRNNVTSSNQDEAAMFSYTGPRLSIDDDSENEEQPFSARQKTSVTQEESKGQAVIRL